tara:strand:- start:66 stop:422 length:357 start_codon:yes stop_codon:yes gene_type:complete
VKTLQRAVSLGVSLHFSALKNQIVKPLLIIFTVITGLVGQGGSKTSDISGYVVDASNGEALPYANVTIKDKDRGTSSYAHPVSLPFCAGGICGHLTMPVVSLPSKSNLAILNSTQLSC